MSDYRIRHSAIASAVMLALASAAAAAQEGTATLDEITVTAQKRTESLQDVPIAVSAVSGTKIAEAGIMKIEDLKNYVPTLFMTETAIGNNISIRGIFSGVNPGFEQSVGTYVDGVYRGRPQQTRAPFLDLERVEVLRGPQSILFGKNSVGGALNITTARPTEEFDAMVSALYEARYDEQEFSAHVSVPFTDRFRGRLAARYREVQGAIHNATLSTEDPSREESTVRAWLEFDVTDNVTASFKAEHGEFDVVGRQIEIDQETPSVSTNPLFAGRTYAQILRVFGQDSSVLNNTSDYVRSSNGGDFSNNETDEFVLQVDWQVGENTVTSITSYSKSVLLNTWLLERASSRRARRRAPQQKTPSQNTQVGKGHTYPGTFPHLLRRCRSGIGTVPVSTTQRSGRRGDRTGGCRASAGRIPPPLLIRADAYSIVTLTLPWPRGGVKPAGDHFHRTARYHHWP